MKKQTWKKCFLGLIVLVAFFFLPVLKPEAATAKKVKYDKLIFVGDSRMVEMSDLVANDNLIYIAKRGVGVNWMQGTGYPKLLKTIKKTEGKLAIIFFIGINDTYNVDRYISAFNSYYTTLKKKGCDMYYLSLTPTTTYPKTPSKSTASVQAFNAKVKSGLKKGIRYLDIFSYFKWGINSVDGVHYTDSSYSSIYTYCLRRLKTYGKVKRGKYNWQYKDGSWYCYKKNGKLYKSRFLELTSGKCYVNSKGKKQANRTFTVKGKTYTSDRFGIIQ